MRPSGECACGRRAARLCRDCALAYCAACSTRRHAKGAFVRHTIVATSTTSSSDRDFDSSSERDFECDAATPVTSAAPDACDECVTAPAALRCTACELRFCARCSALVHRSGALQRHADFATLADEKPAAAATAVSIESRAGWTDAKAAAPSDAVGLKAEMIRDGEATETPLGDEAFDLWSSWSARSFSERSSSIDSTAQWRSLVIDSKPSSSHVGDDHLPLASLSQSLQSLAFAASQPPQEESKAAESPVLFAQRPRSFSDYTSLRSHAPLASSSGDLWREPPRAASTTSASVLELWKAMKTKFPSRHLLVKSAAGAFDAADVQRLTERLCSFGSLARIRDEFALDGLLFFTFFELKSAIGAVGGWFANGSATMASSRSPTRFSPSRPFAGAPAVANFCLPYEAPDEANCATLLVRLSGPPVSSTEMRQFCSRFGEVASMLQNDINSSRYILEFNDARDVPGAMSGLTAAFHSNGAITAARTAPPTQDMAKIQLFQEQLDTAAAARRASPPSFSSSTTSRLTPSPTSTSSSPLNASFLEPPHDDVGGGVGFDISESGGVAQGVRRAASPFDSGSFHMRSSSSGLPDDPIWSGGGGGSTLRPRSSSSSFIGLGSVKAEAASYTPEPAQFANPYSSAVAAAAAAAGSGAGTFPPYMTSHFPQQQQQQQQSLMLHRGGGAHFYQQHLPQRVVGTKYGATRSGSDPNFRAGYANGSGHGPGGHSSGGGGGHPVIGRNDQGVGEFCLSIERVASGADKRTTLMIRNIPNKYTQQMLLAEINARHRGRYDFFYLPIDFKNKCNMGYAFINFMEAESIVPFYKEFDAQKWTNFNSEKVCAISYARLQGKQAMIARFQNSSLLDKHESYRPLVFASAGANRGKPETFPAPKQPQQHHHHKKPQQLLHHHPHHHLVLGGGAGVDGFGGALAHSRLYMPSHQQQLQQMQQAMQHAHQLMAEQFAHGLSPSANSMLHHAHLGYSHPFQPQESHAMNFHLQFPQGDRHVDVDESGAKSMAFGHRAAAFSP